MVSIDHFDKKKKAFFITSIGDQSFAGNSQTYQSTRIRYQFHQEPITVMDYWFQLITTLF